MTKPSFRRCPQAILMALPVALYALFCAAMAVWMGVGGIITRGADPGSLAFLLVAAWAVWFVCALYASLWRCVTSAAITWGLAFGLLGMTIFLAAILHSAIQAFGNQDSWTRRIELETYAPGAVLAAGWIVTVDLLFRWPMRGWSGSRVPPSPKKAPHPLSQRIETWVWIAVILCIVAAVFLLAAMKSMWAPPVPSARQDEGNPNDVRLLYKSREVKQEH